MTITTMPSTRGPCTWFFFNCTWINILGIRIRNSYVQGGTYLPVPYLPIAT
ncbi:hypothetical protein [Chitinophaga rupis]|uniref:hypothetical protein n=1 Tax=Chitinophaga rupis TaxID=573321 RepID=UPI0012DF8CA2|nr:hypothetical protein [Chitinophaga rupis]